MNDLTAHFILRKSAGKPVIALTAYDYPSARIIDETGVVDLILVGDSLGMMVLGHPDTTQVSLGDMLHHTRAAASGVSTAVLASDLPLGTYDTPDKALANAQLLVEAGARAVKLEGGAEMAACIAAVVQQGIPVLAHIGMLPQHIKEEGGYRIKGRTEEQAGQLLADALAVESAGAFAVVLELVTPPLSRKISEELKIPTIGIGSGEGCDGQIRVLHDVIGLFPWFRPKFAQPEADAAALIRDAVGRFADSVRNEKA